MQSQNPPPELSNSNKSILLHLPLPDEIIEEILSWLPVKSLLKFRCVSKSWLSLVGSDRFIKTHFQNSTKYTSLAHHRVVYHYVKEGAVNGCSLQSLLNPKEGFSSSIIIDAANNPSTSTTGNIVGCCNGVLCLLSSLRDGSFFMLWNPATRVSMELPKLDSIYPKFGFGWDESSGAFKVFAASKRNSNKQLSGQVYSSKTNSWKTVALGSLSSFSPFGVFVGGRIQWPMGCFHDDEHVIESFDLESDEFGRIELPPPFNANAAEEYGRLDTFLGEIGGCLCTLFDYKKSIDVWVMKEYGVKDSWFKLITFSLDDVFKRITFVFPPYLGKGPNGEIFIIYGDTLMLYSPKDDAFSTTTGESLCRAHLYIESLVSPQQHCVKQKKAVASLYD